MDINGRPVLEAQIVLPLNMFATARLVYGSDEEMSGSVSLTAGESGEILADVVACRVSAQDGYCTLRCGNGLTKVVGAKHYNQTSAKTVVEDALFAGGVKLDATSPRV